MMNDVSGIVRVVAAYNKKPNKHGNHLQVLEYKLKPIDLKFLQKIFNIDPNDPEPVVSDVILCYAINPEQAKALQPYVIDGTIDLEKYDFMLECYQE